MKKISILVLSTLLAASAARGVEYKPDYKLIDNPVYPTLDLAVATYNVMDYGVDATGKTDCTAAVQSLLDAAAGVGTMTSVHTDSKQRGWYGNPTGGIVYFPKGTYLFTSSLVIPRGVTLRGDWKKPDGKSDISGTIFKVQPRRGAGTEIESSSFIIMQPSTEVYGISFWYPDQNPQSIKKYPPTILLGQTGYFGNDYSNVEHCTFVNSYTAIQFNSQNGGGCPNVFDVYGTPLSKGLVIDCLADVGRFDGLHFSASYWENSGMQNAPSNGEIDSWLYENATGVVMRRNDWSYTCNLDVEGYNCGFLSQISPSNAATQGNPNGHNYNFKLNNCQTGLRIEAASNSGLMFTNIATPGCEIGFDMPTAVIGPVQLYGCDLTGTTNAVLLEETASPGVMMQCCDIDGKVDILNGQFSAINSSFTSDVDIAPKARVIFVGNKMEKSAKLNNESMFECAVSAEPLDLRKLPEFKSEWMERRVTRPSRSALYIVTDAAFGAEPLSLFDNLATAKDNTQAIQTALDKAKADGGGVVYLPTGHYRVNGTLNIPAGVELKGSSDILTIPRGNGSILESYHGKGNVNATPFITMEKGSGLRGITINYPEQNSPVSPVKYPYSVRGNADCYIVNLALRTAYRGVDLFTNKCDNHYVDYLSGHAFMNVIRVGNNSENGVISNIQCNTIAYACGDETKFGCWPNSMNMADNALSAKAYGQNSEDLDFMIIGDCKNQVLYNNFLFGCHQGIVFNNDGNGGPASLHSLGNAVDGAVETFVFNGAADDIDLINSQVVALNHDKTNEYINKGRLSATFVKSGSGFNRSATFFSGNFWGGGDCLVEANGGNINFYSANFATSGAVSTIRCADNAKVNFINVDRRQGDRLVENQGVMEKNCRVEASVINCNNANQSLFDAWNDNLTVSWNLSATDQLLPRTGWKATAFNDPNGTVNARNAIDGNPDSRWTSGQAQQSGQWFAVDFGKPLTINTIILDTAGSPNDGPKSYTVEVCDATGTWLQVADGSMGGSCLIVSFDTCSATAVRINQNADVASGYWSIHEFYVSDIKQSAIGDVTADRTAGVTYANGNLYFESDLVNDNADFEIYSLNGNCVGTASITSDVYSIENLEPGIYIVVVRNANQEITPLKIVKK